MTDTNTKIPSREEVAKEYTWALEDLYASEEDWKKDMEKLIQHFNTYFRQDDCTVFHPIDMEPHIDALLYKPIDAFPFWKLVTIKAKK